MSYVFDASSIYRAIISKKPSLLGGNYSVGLAKFELGNVVWKEASLFKKSEREATLLLNYILEALSTMNLKDVNFIETEILAIKNSMTFYDASYVWLAKELNVQFVTEDGKLRQKAKGTVKTLSVNELIS